MTTVLYVFTTPGDGNFQVPRGASFIGAEGYGSGGGANVWAAPISPKSGGGSAWCRRNPTFAVTPGQIIPYHVAESAPGLNYVFHNPGIDSWLGSSNHASSSCIWLANGANGGIGAGQFAGLASLCKGDIAVSSNGGTTNTLDQGPGSAGAGAAGPNGAGLQGSVTGGTGNGGAGDNGLGGAAGLFTNNANGGNGGNGSEITVSGDVLFLNGILQPGQTFTYGAGGGGASGIPSGDGSSGGPYAGGNGGLYGGGAGTGDGAIFGGIGGSSGQGIMIITAITSPVPFAQVHIYG